MMIDSYNIKHRMTVRQVRESKQNLGELLSFVDKLKTISKIEDEKQAEKELEKISTALMGKSDQQDAFLYETLLDCLQITSEEIDSMEYLDSLVLFNKLFVASTKVEKKQEMQLE